MLTCTGVRPRIMRCGGITDARTIGPSGHRREPRRAGECDGDNEMERYACEDRTTGMYVASSMTAEAPS